MAARVANTPGGLDQLFPELRAAYEENEAARANAAAKKIEIAEKIKKYTKLLEFWKQTEATAESEKKTAVKNLYFWRCERNSVYADTIGKGTKFDRAK